MTTLRIVDAGGWEHGFVFISEHADHTLDRIEAFFEYLNAEGGEYAEWHRNSRFYTENEELRGFLSALFLGIAAGLGK